MPGKLSREEGEEGREEPVQASEYPIMVAC
jgi:hypothetical protein